MKIYRFVYIETSGPLKGVTKRNFTCLISLLEPSLENSLQSHREITLDLSVIHQIYFLRH